MMGYSQRAHRRGAMSEEQFLTQLQRRGFRLAPRGSDELHAFTHPDTGDRRYVMVIRWGDTFSSALERIIKERDETLIPMPAGTSS